MQNLSYDAMALINGGDGCGMALVGLGFSIAGLAAATLAVPALAPVTAKCMFDIFLGLGSAAVSGAGVIYSCL